MANYGKLKSTNYGNATDAVIKWVLTRDKFKIQTFYGITDKLIVEMEKQKTHIYIKRWTKDLVFNWIDFKRRRNKNKGK